MKKKFFVKSFALIGFIASVIIGISCSNYAYQVVTLESIGATFTDDYMKISDKFIDLEYNFWDKNGPFRFKIYNKSDKSLIIDLDKSHFIFNGESFDYFNNASINKEKSSIHLSPRSYITINKYNFLDQRFIICEIENIVGGISTKKFDKNNSPLKITNYLTYYFEGEPNNILHTTNDFWVSEVSNMKFKNFAVEDKYIVGCSNTSTKKVYKYLYAKPNSAYFIYIQGSLK